MLKKLFGVFAEPECGCVELVQKCIKRSTCIDIQPKVHGKAFVEVDCTSGKTCHTYKPFSCGC